MTTRVKPTIALRLFTGLIIAPLVLVGGILLAVNVLFPVFFPAGVSFETAAPLFLIAGAIFLLLYAAFDMDLVPGFLAWLVGRRWADRIEHSRLLRPFFRVERQDH